MNSSQKVLNEEQLKAIEYGNGPLLIIAGAGTGKTTVITERIKYLILNKKIHPSQILALTFTEKAALEMQERIDQAMPYGYTQMWISTFHAFCDRILRSEAIHIGLNPSYKLMTEAESVLFLRQNLFKLELEYFRPLGNPHKFLEGLLQHFSRLRDEDISPSEYVQWAKSQNTNEELNIDEDEIRKNVELANAYKIYEELKIKEGVMDFSDLISNSLKLFRTRKNILSQYQKQFKYILLDEFQDTNFAQNTLSILLAGEARNITVVGDDDQAIYRWRGAAISNMVQFRKHFKNANIITLNHNYRSSKEILDSSYLLIQNNNPDRLEVKEKINKKLIPARKIKGNKVEFIFQNRVEDEAEEVLKKILELVKNKNLNYKDFAILVRANDHAQPFIKAFERGKIPYQFLGPGRLFHQEEIKDLIAYLKVLFNFEDSISLYRVLINPIFKIENIEISALLNLAKKKNYSLFEALEKCDQIFLKEETKEKIKNLIAIIKKHLDLVSKESAGQILYYFLRDSGILKKLISPDSQINERKAQNIARFFEKLKTFEAEHEDASVFAIVDWIDLSMQMGESPLAADMEWTDNNAVNILTIHSSKGLEFPVVFLVNLVAQRFPVRERREQIPVPQDLIKEILPEGDFHLQEERRLFYVGMTRARDYLFLTAANFYGEGKRERKISPFVIETLGEKSINNYFLNQKNEKTFIQPSLLEWISPNNSVIQERSVTFPGSTINYKLTYLSYSQIQTFKICPLHYKCKYILKIPVAQSAAQSFGLSIHTALRNFYQSLLKGENLKSADILNIVEQSWVNEGYESKTHEKTALEKAKKLALNYLKNNYNPKNLPVALELPFQFYLKNEARIPIKIGGRIDRIDRLEDGRIEILDYKTGSNIPTEKDLKNDLQLTTYALAATEVNDRLLGKTPEEVVLSLYYLEEDKKITTVRTREQLEAAKIEILQKIEEIEKSDFTCSRSIFCANCEYKILCSSR